VIIRSESMEKFMDQWGTRFFEEAKKTMKPYYEKGTQTAEKWDKVVQAAPKVRHPFPAQADTIAALAAHLFGRDKKAAFLCADMGSGKTLMSILASTIAAHLGRPRRSIVVVPPHMVEKWCREISQTVLNVRVVNINGQNGISKLQREVLQNPKQPDQTEFWVVGRVRARMSYRKRTGLQVLTPKLLKLFGFKDKHVCPDCGKPVIVKLTEQKADKLREEGHGSRIRVLGNDETGEGMTHYWYPDAHYFASGRRTCEWVEDGDELERGCGAQLWQAQRAVKANTRDLQIKALSSLEGIGEAKAAEIVDSPEKGQILHFLSAGIVSEALIRKIGRAAAARVQKQLDEQGFTSCDADYSIAEFIKRKIPRGWFHFAIFDEVHELDGDATAQGVAMGIIASQVTKTIALTGTLVDGYAGSLFPLLFRMYPEQMMAAGYTAHDAALFQQEMGVVKEVIIEEEEDNFKASRGKKLSRTQTRNLPGLDPVVITDFILPNAIFIELKDLEAGVQQIAAKHGKKVQFLPSYRETFVSLEPAPEDKEQLQSFTRKLSDIMEKAFREKDRSTGSRAFAMMTYAPDGAYEQIRFDDQTCFTPKNPGAITPKEQFLVDLCLREKSQGRRVIAFSIYPGKNNLLSRYENVLAEAGLRVKTMRSSVSTDKREAWMEKVVKEGVDVVLCNPELVKTGLDFLAFPTLVFTQTGWSTSTVLQALKRSWRIGQVNPVRTYLLGYVGTGQMVPLKLVAKKIAVANQSKGDIAKNSMSHLIEEEDGGMLAMANLILEEMRSTNHDPIVGSISSLAEDNCEGEFGATPMSVIADLMRMEAQSQMEKIREEQPVLLGEDSILSRIFAQAQAGKEKHTPAPTQAPQAQRKNIGGLITIEDPFDLF